MKLIFLIKLLSLVIFKAIHLSKAVSNLGHSNLLMTQFNFY